MKASKLHQPAENGRANHVACRWAIANAGTAGQRYTGCSRPGANCVTCCLACPLGRPRWVNHAGGPEWVAACTRACRETERGGHA